MLRARLRYIPVVHVGAVVRRKRGKRRGRWREGRVGRAVEVVARKVRTRRTAASACGHGERIVEQANRV